MLHHPSICLPSRDKIQKVTTFDASATDVALASVAFVALQMQRHKRDYI